jgi:hypothetical protein
MYPIVKIEEKITCCIEEKEFYCTLFGSRFREETPKGQKGVEKEKSLRDIHIGEEICFNFRVAGKPSLEVLEQLL